jgi:hypothetical protein
MPPGKSGSAFLRKNGRNPLGRRDAARAAAAWLRTFLAVFGKLNRSLIPALANLERVRAGDGRVIALREIGRSEWCRRINAAVRPLAELAGELAPAIEAPSDFAEVRAWMNWLRQVGDALQELVNHESKIALPAAEIALALDWGHGRAIEAPPVAWRASLNARLAQVLQQVDLRRIRRCEICGRAFHAPRRKSTRCSGRCDNLARQRKLSERVAMTAQLLSEGKTVGEITRQLKVTTTQVRRYAAAARRNRGTKITPGELAAIAAKQSARVEAGPEASRRLRARRPRQSR